MLNVKILWKDTDKDAQRRVYTDDSEDAVQRVARKLGFQVVAPHRDASPIGTDRYTVTAKTEDGYYRSVFCVQFS